MTNSAHAYPQLDVQCADRVRRFCFNLGALRALEQHMEKATSNPHYSATRDFPWESEKIQDIAVVIWAGFFCDAQNDKEVWTLDKACENIDLLGIAQVRGLIVESLSRILTPEQKAQAKASLAEGEAKKKPSRKRKSLRKS